MTVYTIMADIARDMMGDEDPITDMITLHPTTNLGNLSSDLMAENSGCLFDAIPFHDIAAADTTCQHLDQ